MPTRAQENIAAGNGEHGDRLAGSGQHDTRLHEQERKVDAQNKADLVDRAFRAYTEMVARLWDAGQVLAALELETLWREPAGGLPLPEEPAPRTKELGPMVEFDAARDAPGRARRMVILALRSRGCRGALVSDGALVVTELAANAVLHARSPFSVSVSLRDAMLRIAVADRRPLIGTWADHGLIPRQGHGLGLIDTLCTRWGTEIVADGKVVWAELRLSSSS
jgi:anti-sigma regulatory factor (Ser/Thr protein kinase)